jgi:KaiC/GvpD/RAD55 family RecA-like ATPase
MILPIEKFEELRLKDIKPGYKLLFRGEPGTLKSTLAFYSIWENIDSSNQGIYLLFEENEKIFLDQLKSMNIYDDRKAKKQWLTIIPFSVYPYENEINGKIITEIGDDIFTQKNFTINQFLTDIENYLEHMKQSCEEKQVKMIVFDPLSTIKDFYQKKNPIGVRTELQQLFKHPLFEKVVTIFITEKTREPYFHNAEEYLADGIFDLMLHPTIPSKIVIQCRKMRGHDINRIPHVLMFEKESKGYKFKLGETVPGNLDGYK